MATNFVLSSGEQGSPVKGRINDAEHLYTPALHHDESFLALALRFA
jgi:hypothetical protein